MFTGIITDVGRVRRIRRNGDTRIRIETAYDTATIDIGASIACSGVCFTVVAVGDEWFEVDVSAETLSRTVLGGWSEGSRVNLERSLRVGDEMGGHITTGHVDATATLVSRETEGDSIRMLFEIPEKLSKYIAEKGSIAVDGISLTVNAVESSRFAVNIIPHTQEKTTLGNLGEGDRANVEVDILARYVERLRDV